MRPVPAKNQGAVQNGVGKGWVKGGYGLIFAIKGLENGGYIQRPSVTFFFNSKKVKYDQFNFPGYVWIIIISV